MSQPVVLVCIPVQKRHLDTLQAAAPACRLVCAAARDVTHEMIAGADVVIGNVPAAQIQGAPNLKLLQLNSAGTDAYIAPGVLAPDTVLANASGAYGQAVAEHMLAMTLALQKKLHLYRDAQRQCIWGDEGGVTSMCGATVLCVGAGDIGTRYARLAKALGAHTIGIRRRHFAPDEALDAVRPMDDLDALLGGADVVASFLPGTGNTRHTFGRTRLAAMKRGAIFVNGGRGNAVDTEALVDALKNGPLYAAALDVTDPEPLPADHPLWTMPNALVTPHVSGGFHLPQTFERIVQIAARNLAHFACGEPFENEVDRQSGYRK